jgi:hypothetical protein
MMTSLSVPAVFRKVAVIETIQSLRFIYPEQPALAQLRKPFGMLPDIDSLFLKMD